MSLLLAFAMILALTPGAMLAENDPSDPPASETQPGDDSGDESGDNSGDDSGDNSGDDSGDSSGDDSGDQAEPDTPPASGQVTKMELEGGTALHSTGERKYELQLIPDPSAENSVRVTVNLEPNSTANKKLNIEWTVEDDTIVRVNPSQADDDTGSGHVAYIIGNPQNPGKTTVTVTAGNMSCTIDITVVGIKLSDALSKNIELLENESMTLEPGRDFFFFGEFDDAALKATVEKTSLLATVNPDKTVTIQAVRADTVTVSLAMDVGGRSYKAEFRVVIKPNISTIEWTAGVSVSEPLLFSELESLISAQCFDMLGASLVSVTDLSVSTAEGTLYLGYKSQEDTGAGVGSTVSYYVRSASRGPYLSDITFVPNARFTGEKVTITYTGTGANNRTFRGRIEVALKNMETDVIFTTRRDTPLALSSDLLSKVCQESLGSPLSYVIFTQPTAAQGILYRDWKGEGDYAAQVTASERFSVNEISRVTFVPAQGYVGTVHIGYAGYSVSGGKFNGELVIEVKQGLDDAIVYTDNGGGYASFSQGDFADFCLNATGSRLSSVSFTLPPASQGKLYEYWRGGRDRGIEVTPGVSYGSIELNRITFVAADGFTGTVRIPFAGTAINGSIFAGTVEVHIQSAGGSGLSYICTPGQSVKLDVNDFADFCQSATGQRLHYITFPSLPDFNMGSLYHNRTAAGSMGSRVTSATKYFQSAPPYIANLSFWATSNFRGVLEIPFTGSSVDGTAFSGVLEIRSGEGGGSGSSSAVAYSVYGQQGVFFQPSDFDAACRQATNSPLSYVRFTLPYSSVGILYYDYQGGAQAALSPTVNLYTSGDVSISKVAFVPAPGYSGVVSIPFNGWGIDGQGFRGTVEITVHAQQAMGAVVRYYTTGVPVQLNAYDLIAAAGGSQPVTVRLTGLPSAGQGRIYYQYASPTHYSWQGDTTTGYSIYGDPSFSNLTFIPRAGYQGAVTIPYIAAAYDGSRYEGTIRIEVAPPSASAYFDDMAGCAPQTLAAVDYLCSQGVVGGTGYRRYDPDASIRRGDFCLMLVRAFQFSVGGSSQQGFSDVPYDAYYAYAVNQLYALGIVNGVGGRRFAPSSPVSRQDAALMVQRALQKAGLSAPDGNTAGLAAFSDREKVAGYARGAVSGLAQMGLLPTANGQLNPGGDLTRADMAVLLHRAMTMTSK